MRSKNNIELAPDQHCVRAGEVYESPAVLGSPMNGNCCKGLIPIAQYSMAPGEINCELFNQMGGGDSICSACGNGHCEPWENKCNCPQDCK